MRVSGYLAAGLVLPLSLVIGALSGAGCGDVDAGAEPFAGTVRYQDPGGEYQLHLLEPPWIPISLQGESVFVVPPSEIKLESTEADALYSLHVTGLDDEATRALAAAAAAATPPWDLSRKRTVRTVSGATGAEVSWQEGTTAYHREVFVGAVSSRCYHLHFTAKRPIADESMITQMIVSFSPGMSAALTGANP
jgi:hypothetical protein